MATPPMQQDFPVPKGPLGPSNSTICPRTAPKRPPKALAFVHIGRRQPQTKNRPYLGLHGSKPNLECTLSTRNHPLLAVSTPQNYLNRRLGPVGCGKLQEGVAQRGGCQNGSTRSTWCKKQRLFSKMILNHMECQKKCFWRVLSLWWPILALLRSQNALKMGCVGTKKGSKMSQKWVFLK